VGFPHAREIRKVTDGGPERAREHRIEPMSKIALIARLKDGAEAEAQELLLRGPPFDPVAAELERHTVFLSAGEVVFVFEGVDVEWKIDELVDEPFAWPMQEALDAWKPLIESPPRIARPVFEWERT
jgi:hypothetical protein